MLNSSKLDVLFNSKMFLKLEISPTTVLLDPLILKNVYLCHFSILIFLYEIKQRIRKMGIKNMKYK